MSDRLIRLVLQTPQLLEAMDSPHSLQDQCGLVAEPHHLDQIRELVRFSLGFHEQIKALLPWVGYLSVLNESSQIVGCCGFKGNPVDERVEIAYHTFADLEKRGYGTAAAAELTDIALKSPDVTAVVAHTLPERNASCRILEKNRFECLGDFEDPEDGPVWRWETRK